MPLFAWTLGLFALYVIYSYNRKALKLKGFFKSFFLFVMVYWVLLLVMETIAFHWIGIKNIATGRYDGLPVCNCIHAPIFMKVAYFSLGIIYFFIIDFINRLLSLKKEE